MGAIKLDANKVNKNVLPNIDKAITNLQNSYDYASSLKSKLPSNFTYRSNVSNIVSKINSLKSDTRKLRNNIEEKSKKVEKIETKKAANISKLATLVAKLGNDNVNFGAVKTTSTTSKFKGDVENNKVGKNVKKDISKTGAKTTKSFSSKIKAFGTKVLNKIKETGTNVSNSFKSMVNSLKKSKEVATDWLKKKLEEAQNKSDEILKSTGATIKKVSKTIITGAKIYIDFHKRTQASIMNTVVALSKGIVSVGEAVVDLLALGITGLGTLGSGAVDIINGITTGKWEWKETKALWDSTKAFVANEWTNKVYDKFYETKIGKYLDENAYAPFKSDGMVFQIAEGIGNVIGIIGLTVATGGIGGVAVGAGSMAATATAVGFSKYTSEEWNKNSISLNYQGEDVNVSINYEKYSEIEKLKQGESTTITQQITLEDGSIQELTFKITSNGDGTYKITDNVGNDVKLNNLEESSTAKGLLVGGIKGLWDGAQWFIGSKIGTGQFSKVTSGIKNEISKKLATSGIRVGLDTLTGIVEVPFQSLVTMISENKTWKEAWESQGGWSAVLSQAGIAGISSAAGEAFDLKKILKMDNSNGIDNATKVTNSNNLDVNSKVSNNVKSMDDQIANANYRTSKGNFVGINLTSLDDITLDQLKKIDDIDNTFFNYNGKQYSWIEMRNALESTQNVAKAVDVKVKSMDDQIANANYRTSKGNFVGINLNSIDDITLEQLKKIDDIDNTFFNYNGKNYSWIQMRNMLETNQNVAKAVDVKVKTMDDQIANANYRTSKGNFVGINLNSIDDITLDQLKKIDDIDNTFFNYNGKQYSVSDMKNMLENNLLNTKNGINLKEKIYKNMPKRINSLEKAKLLYNRLNEEVSYSSQYFAAKTKNAYNKEILDSFASKKVDLTNFDDSNIVCYNWADMYSELLTEQGIENYVRGTNHKWVTFTIDGKYYFADATNNYSSATDLTRAQTGLKSYGFFEVGRDEFLSNNFGNQNNIAVQNFSKKWDEGLGKKIDKKIGYDYEDILKLSNQGDAETKIRDLKKLGLSKDASSSEIANAKLCQRIFPKLEKLGVMEGITYFNILKKMELNFYEMSEITSNILVNKNTFDTAVVYSVNGNSKMYLYKGKNKIVETTIEELKKLGYVDYK